MQRNFAAVEQSGNCSHSPGDNCTCTQQYDEGVNEHVRQYVRCGSISHGRTSTLQYTTP